MDNFSDSIEVQSRGIKLTQQNKDHMKRKLSFLERFSKYIDHIDILVEKNPGESINLKYEISVSVKHGLIRVEERGVDLYSLIDAVNETLKPKIEKYKDKYTDHGGEKPVDETDDSQIDVTEPDTETPLYSPKITKRKTYSDNRPLHPSEAIEQMEMLGHISFLFRNIETDRYTMVYKRKDGNYGLVEPESA